MTGAGNGEFKGDDFVGSTCRPHKCDEKQGPLPFQAGSQGPCRFEAYGQENRGLPNVNSRPEKAKAAVAKTVSGEIEFRCDAATISHYILGQPQ